jgi:hypothetical protein
VILPKLPEDDYSLVIRTDFSDDRAWEQVCQLIQEPQTEDGFQASVECISEKSCSDVTPEKVASILPTTSPRAFVFLVDNSAINHPEHPVLVVDLAQNQGRSFRVIPSEAWAVENNLRLANMDFAEFAESVGRDGVFRGFPRY